MNKLKVLYIITKQDTGGAQKYVRDLATNLDKNKFEAKILYGVTDLKWLSNKVKPHFLFLNDWLAIFELIKIFRRERPDIIHLNSSKTGVLGSLAAGIYKLFLKINPIPQTLDPKPLSSNPIPYTLYPKIVFTAHGWVFNPTNYISAPVRGFYILLHKFAALFQHQIINVSEYDRLIALKYKIAPPYKLSTIHSGIDPNIPFLNKQPARKKILETLNPIPYTLNPNLPWVGSIGRLTKEKNYETLIKAAALIYNANYAKPKANDAKFFSQDSQNDSRHSHYLPYFFIIGSGPEHQKLKLLITNYKLQENFFIVPPSLNDAILLRAFDVFALSSIKEGLPYTLLEAITAKVAIAATPAGGITEAIIHEETGLISPIKSPAVLAGNIRKLLNEKNLNADLSASAKLKLQNDFSIKKMISETTAAYLTD